MTISMYKVSVPIFVQFLTGLSGCIDKAGRISRPSSSTQLSCSICGSFPTCIHYARQVQQATTPCRCAAAARSPASRCRTCRTPRRASPSSRRRIAKTIDFCQGLQAGADRRHRGQGDHAQARRQRAQVHRAGAAAQLHPAELLFPLHHRLRHPAPLRHRARQARLHEHASAALGSILQVVLRFFDRHG